MAQPKLGGRPTSLALDERSDLSYNFFQARPRQNLLILRRFERRVSPVSKLDPSTLGSPLHDTARTRDAELAAIIGERAEREGLPRNYRMRADSHYVDQL